jgi:two-component system cell cycle sensor histidine kinase/response regulator CckA
MGMRIRWARQRATTTSMKYPSAESVTLPAVLRERAEHVLRERKPTPTRLYADNPYGYELQLHEVELRMQNEALRDLHVEVAVARERYADLFEHAPMPYLVLDQDSSILEANLAAAKFLQLDRAQLIGSKLASFLEPSLAERFALHVRTVLGTAATQSIELSFRSREQGPREVRLECVRESLNPRQWRAALFDMTAQRQLQGQLERSRRLEAIGTFASGIAHDFSGLLAVVAGGADLALEQCQTGGDVIGPLRRVQRATVQGKAMVRQLLRYASGPEPEGNTLCMIDSAIRGAESSLRQLAGPSVDVALTLNAAGAEVSLDLGGPEEILQNLASNAQHALPNGGTLQIATKVVDAHVGHDPQSAIRRYVKLTVKDDGVGMDAETQRRVFEPFFTTKPRGKGTGLGLAMVYGIVKRSGGHVQLASEPGCGTTFEIYLPVSNAQPERAQQTRTS